MCKRKYVNRYHELLQGQAMPAYDKRSAEADRYRQLYKTAQWQRVRARQLAYRPLCEWCERRGQLTAATVCHHADPGAKRDPSRFYAGPFVSLCSSCHDIDAQRLELGAPARAPIGADGWPLD
jgi:hypothetical protein